jgi:hypothetical protein
LQRDHTSGMLNEAGKGYLGTSRTRADPSNQLL